MAEKPVRKEAGFEILSLPFVYCTRNIKFVFIDDSILEDTNGDDSVDIIDVFMVAWFDAESIDKV